MTNSNFSSTQNPQNFSFGSSRLLNYFGLASSTISSQLGFLCISLPQYDFVFLLGRKCEVLESIELSSAHPFLFMTFWERQQWSLSLDLLFFIVRVQTISWYPLNLFLLNCYFFTAGYVRYEFCGSFLLIFKSFI